MNPSQPNHHALPRRPTSPLPAVQPGGRAWPASHTMRIFWLIILVAVAVGCTPSKQPVAAGGGVLDETGVLAIARAAVATNDTWVARAEFETPQRQPDGSWSVLVWRRPAMWGGHRFITIDPQGKVTNYGRGL